MTATPSCAASSTPAAAVAGKQARVIGSLQHPLVAGDRAGVARLLRELAPMYAQLQASLSGG